MKEESTDSETIDSDNSLDSYDDYEPSSGRVDSDSEDEKTQIDLPTKNIGEPKGWKSAGEWLKFIKLNSIIRSYGNNQWDDLYIK